MKRIPQIPSVRRRTNLEDYILAAFVVLGLATFLTPSIGTANNVLSSNVSSPQSGPPSPSITPLFDASDESYKRTRFITPPP